MRGSTRAAPAGAFQRPTARRAAFRAEMQRPPRIRLNVCKRLCSRRLWSAAIDYLIAVQLENQDIFKKGGSSLASAARDLRYRGGRSVSVDGNLARSLDYEVRERELRHAGEAPRRRETAQENPKVRSLPKVRLREAQHVAPLAVLGAAAAAVLAVLLLLSYIQLTVLSSNMVELRSELKALEKKNVILTTQYEQIYDLATVKKAAEAAGMTKPGASQVYYVDGSDGDAAVVYRREESGLLDNFRDSLHNGIYTVVEYFD